MGLTDDQKAMLRLLAQREEGYEDMAALMGISVEEVRERVKEALAEVEEPEKDVPAEEPPAPAPSPPLTPAPPAPKPAEQAPTEQPPPSAATALQGKGEEAKPSGRRAQLPSLKVPKDRGALIGLGAGAIVVVILVVVLIVGGGGSSSSDTESGPTAAELNLAENASSQAESKDLTQAILSASDGSEATGRAIFGRFQKKVLLQVTGEGLEPSSSGESYAVWLSHSGQAMVPVGTVKVKSSGRLAARFEIPAAVLVLVAEGAFDQIDVTRTTDSQLNAAIATARKTEKESTYTGTPAMSGKITGPLVGATK